MKTSRGNETSYDFVSVKVADEGRPVPHVRLQCISVFCSNQLLGNVATTTNRPEAIAKWARQKGWKIDPLRPSSVRCPECQRADRLKAHGDKAEKKEKQIMPESNVATIAPPARKLTAEEKLKVRQLLDAQFDEAKGIYLDGYSDQRVGSESGVPWANVREIREAAYGALKSSPEIDALIGEQGALTARINKARTEFDAVAKDVASLRERVLALSVKLFGTAA